MPRSAAAALCAAAAILAAGLVTACGDDDGLSDDALAQVGTTNITKSDFERALTLTVGRGEDPRDYAACAARKQRSSAGSAGATTEAQLERECKKQYQALKSNVMDFLIKAEWTRQEAEARHIVLTEAETRAAVDKAKEGGLLSAAALRRAGLTERQFLPRIRQNQLQTKVTEELTASSRTVSRRDVARYYRRNRKQLVVPERRDLRIVITRSPTRAQAARTALERGRSWKAVARRYSLHVGSRDRGGRIKGLRKAEQQKGLASAIFEAPEGDLVGPVERDGAWAVFVVEDVNPSFHATLEQARDEIEALLTSTRRQRALTAFTKKYRDQTTCAAGYRVSSCKNGPRPRSAAS